MPYSQRWAYEFFCDNVVEDLPLILNEKGPWQWQRRESFIHGLYINTRPSDDVHVKINEYPQGFVQGTTKKTFAAILEVREGSRDTEEEVDAAFLKILSHIRAVDIRSVEPYD